GAGSNTLDYSLYSTSIHTNLYSGASTAIDNASTNGFYNIQTVVGGSANDYLGGPNTDSVWNITGNNAGNINGSVSFSSFEHLIGGNGNDTFAFSDGK